MVQTIKIEASPAVEYTVTIKVVDKNDNRPISGVIVGYFTVVTTMESPTDANGIASFVLSEARTYKFFAYHPDYKNIQQELIIDSTSPKNSEMTLTLEPLKQKNGVFVTISLVAQDDRQPVPDAKVYLSGSVLKAVYSGVTDQAGKLTLFVTDGGKYTVDIYHSNFKTVKGNLEVNIYGDQKDYPLTYELQRQDKRRTGEETKQLKIQVNGSDENAGTKPLAGATIYFGNDSRKTDKDGIAVFEHNLEVGTYGKFYVEAQGYETKEESFVVGQYARTPLVHRPSRWQRWLRWGLDTGTPADTIITTTLVPAKKDALVFIVEVTDAEKNNQLIENSTVELKLCNPVVIEGKQKGIFAVVETSSGRAKFTIPANLLANICSVRASHPKYEERWSDIDQKLLALSTEPRYFAISLKPKKEEPQGQLPDFEWQLTKTVQDPGNLTGKAIGGYNVCDVLTKSSATIHNDKLPGTRTSVQASADIPQTLKPNQKFNITMSVFCTTEGEYCCIDAGVATDGIECTPTKRVGGCSKGSKSMTESQVYECTAPKVQHYDTLAVAPFVGGLGVMARYEYTEKKLIEYQPGSSSSSSKESTASNTVSQASTAAGVESILSYLPVPSMEPDTDRPGMDYDSFELSVDDPKQCQNACVMDTNCKAYTYVKPGIQGKARCYLKNGVPSSRKNNSCISGVKP